MKKFWVKTGGRLHLGQLDLNGSLGRLYGGLGLAIDQPELEIAAEKCRGLCVQCSNEGDRRRLEKAAQQYLTHYNLPGIRIELIQALPSHSGLGSGTQLSLAAGFAITRVYGLYPAITELGSLTDREGSCSGIGVAAFGHGGFLVDGGKPLHDSKESNNEVPPLLARMEFPVEWGILLALPEQEEKMSGSKEKKAFRSLPPMTEEVSGAICRLLLLKLLPGLKEKNLQAFGEAITEIQAYLGDYFLPVQGGRYSSVLAATIAEYWLTHGAAGVGQSSWGPLVYGFTTRENLAALCQETKLLLGSRGGVWAVTGRNQGASWGWE